MFNVHFKVFENFENIIGRDVSFNLVEISPHLSQAQYELLCSRPEEPAARTSECESTSSRPSSDSDTTDNAFKQGQTKDSNLSVTWYKELQDVPKEFSFYIAHEFFDALPIHKIQVSLQNYAFPKVYRDFTMFAFLTLEGWSGVERSFGGYQS